MGQRTMPPAHYHPAATRRHLNTYSLHLLLSLHLLFFLGRTKGAIHIPNDYVTNDLKQPPVITFQTKSYTAFYQLEVTLRCEASGNPAPTYRWMKDGRMLESTTSGVITAAEVDNLKSYHGKYRCYASNELGTAMSDEIELITDSPPILPKEKRVKKTVNEGDSVVLPCTLPKSSVTPNIHWMDRRLRHISLSKRVTIGLDGRLYFANVLISDTRDEYTCNAQYTAARFILAKEPITLTVTPSKMKMDRPPLLHHPEGSRSQYLALRGDPLSLECIPHGLPTPTVNWKRKDGSLTLSSRITMSSFNHRLEFREVLESDDGEYSCTATNDQGSISHTYTVTVEAAPHWTKVPQNQLYAPGETITLDCQAEGIPTPDITWRINGIPITEIDKNQRRKVVGGTLRLNNAQYEDTAVYQCEASNKHGTSLINAYIYIIELPPQILTEDKLVYNLTEGNSAFLSCSAFGSPLPQVTWKNENPEVILFNERTSKLTNGTLLIADVTREDSGTYYCSVKNSNQSISATLVVLRSTSMNQRCFGIRQLDRSPNGMRNM